MEKKIVDFINKCGFTHYDWNDRTLNKYALEKDHINIQPNYGAGYIDNCQYVFVCNTRKKKFLEGGGWEYEYTPCWTLDEIKTALKKYDFNYDDAFENEFQQTTQK